LPIGHFAQSSFRPFFISPRSHLAQLFHFAQSPSRPMTTSPYPHFAQ
jgi:hypothetical protein